MLLSTILEEIRGLYVSRLAMALREARKLKLEPHVEPLLRDENELPRREGALDSPLRLDLVVQGRRGYESLTVDSTERISFEPATIAWNDTFRVTLAPFVWDCAFLETDVAIDALKVPVGRWLERWTDPKGTNKPGEHGLLGVVHFAADPVAKPGGSRLSVDLGSAPIEALLALLDALAEAGATEARIVGAPQRPRKKKKAAKKKAVPRRKAAPKKKATPKKKAAPKKKGAPKKKVSAKARPRRR